MQIRKKVIYPELSYKINGILFKAHNNLGRFCNEQQYCDAIESYFDDSNLKYKREMVIPPSFENELRGRNRIDFLVDGKVIIEIKTKRFLEKDDYY